MGRRHCGNARHRDRDGTAGATRTGATHERRDPTRSTRAHHLRSPRRRDGPIHGWPATGPGRSRRKRPDAALAEIAGNGRVARSRRNGGRLIAVLVSRWPLGRILRQRQAQEARDRWPPGGGRRRRAPGARRILGPRRDHSLYSGRSEFHHEGVRRWRPASTRHVRCRRRSNRRRGASVPARWTSVPLPPLRYPRRRHLRDRCRLARLPGNTRGPLQYHRRCIRCRKAVLSAGRRLACPGFRSEDVDRVR